MGCGECIRWCSPGCCATSLALLGDIVLISTLGGISILGINGFVIGPAIAAMFIAVWGMLSASRSGSRPVHPDT
jgi:predicted PurR-regulated permease PerM